MPFRYPNSFDGHAAVEEVEREPVETRVPVRTTLGLVADSAACFPDKLALRFLAAPGAAAQDWSYGELLQAVTRAANIFHAMGVARADVVAFLTLTSPLSTIATLAAQACGVSCAVNPYLSEEAIASIIAEARARVLVIDGPATAPAVYDKLAGVLDRLREKPLVLALDPEAGGLPSLPALMRDSPSRARGWQQPSEADVCAYFHTGGTTGMPKLARQTHRAQAIASWLCSYALGVTSADIAACGMPQFHVGGALACTLAHLGAGGTVVQMGRMGFRETPFLDAFWDLVDEYRVSTVIAVPTTHGATLARHRPGQGRSLRVVCGGATGLPDALVRRYAQETGHIIRNPWGLTEATLAVSMTPATREIVPGSVGIRLPYVRIEAREVTPSGAPGTRVPAGATGALFVRGPTVFAGYLRPRADEGSSRDEGWLCTGDLGRIDEEGRIFLTGRAKDLIIRGGHNLDPSLIEECVARHPAVADCAAVGYPDERVGEVPVVFVALRPQAALDADALVDFVRERIAEPAATPKHVFILEALPQTAVGKTFKPALRQLAAEHALRAALDGIECSVSARMDAVRGLVVQVACDAESRQVVAGRIAGFSLPIDLSQS